MYTVGMCGVCMEYSGCCMDGGEYSVLAVVTTREYSVLVLSSGEKKNTPQWW